LSRHPTVKTGRRLQQKDARSVHHAGSAIAKAAVRKDHGFVSPLIVERNDFTLLTNHITLCGKSFSIRTVPEHLYMRETRTEDRYKQGITTRRAVLGDAHVDRAEAAESAFDQPFQQLITEAAWGHVWSRPNWTKRERSMVTIALLAALGHDEEIAMHIRATVNTGASREDIREAMLHVAIYAGVPAANHAIKIAKRVFDEMDGKEEK
jgi:4-carboxymuconolactone decarboxylase